MTHETPLQRETGQPEWGEPRLLFAPEELVGAHCLPGDPHCVTCSDDAQSARVLRVESETGLALVALEDAPEADPLEVDITLVGEVAPGEVVLVHGGVAL